MSKIIKVGWFRKIALMSLFVFLAGGVWIAWSSTIYQNFGKTAKAAFNPEFSRYEDTLNDTQTIAKYTYYVVNTSPNPAPGYFAMSLESFNQNPVNNEIEIVGVKQSFPVSLDGANSNPTVINENINQVSFDSGNIKYIKLVPGSTCNPDPNGGCAIGSIPANMPIAVEISVKMKNGLTSSDILNGSGKVVFPNGFDVNSVGWKINLNPTVASIGLNVSIDNISPTQNESGSGLSVSFTTVEYTNTPGGMHTHFYFNTENNSTINKMYSGPSPYFLPLSSIPTGTSQICSIVANPNHTIIQNTGNCANLPSIGTPTNNQTVGNQNNSTTTSVLQNSIEASFPAGMPETLQFTVNNTSSAASDVYIALGLHGDSWSDAKQTTIKPTQDCHISLSADLSFVGGCSELFDGSGFKIVNLPAGASTQVKVSRVINTAKPNSTLNELQFSLFSSLSNDFSAAANPSKTTVAFNSKYTKSLSITKEKVSDSQKYGGNLAFAQIVSPYTDVIFAISVKNQSQVGYTGVNIRDVLDQNTQDYFNNCSFSQAQSLNSFRTNVVGTSNMQGIARDGLKDYTLNNLVIPAANDTNLGEIVFYVGCDQNSMSLPTTQKLQNTAQIVSFDASIDSFYNLPDDLIAKANANSSQNLKIEKSLVSKSNGQFTTGTQATYKIKITNTSSNPSEEITVADLIQVPEGVLVHTDSSSVVTDLINPFQAGSLTSHVAEISSGNFGLDAAYPLNTTGTDSLGNTIRTFKINKLKGGDTFEFKYKLIFNGTFPSSCNVDNIGQIPALRNIAILSNLVVSNGIPVSGSSTDLSVGGVASFIKFNQTNENTNITLANNVIYQDSNLSDNIAIVDHTSALCFDSQDIVRTGDGTSQQPTTLTSNDIPNLKIVCLPVTPGAATDCSFKLPVNIILPSDFQIGIGDGIMSSCVRINFSPENQNGTSEYVVCKSVATPVSGQSTTIFGRIGSGSRVLTSQKLAFDKSSGLGLTLSPLNNGLETSFNLQNTQFSSSIPSFEISLNEGDNLASFEPAALSVNSDTKTTITNLVPCTSYKLKFSLNDNLGNLIASVIKDFKTSGCVNDKEILAEKTVPVSSTAGGSLKLTDGNDQLDLTLPPNFSTSDKKIQAKKLSQTESNISSLPKLPKSSRLAKNKTFDLKAFTGTSSLTTTFDQPLNLKINYTDQDVSLLDKDSLKIRSWNGTEWQDLTDCVNDKVNKTVACDTTHFSLFALSGQTALDTADIKWNFSPKSGLNAPFFKDATPISINLSNFTASRNNIVNDGEFVCKFEMTPIRASNPVTTVLTDNIPYSPSTGCSTSITKAQRGNILKLNIKVTITNTSNSAQKYIFNTNYMLNFKGAGIATATQ